MPASIPASASFEHLSFVDRSPDIPASTHQDRGDLWLPRGDFCNRDYSYAPRFPALIPSTHIHSAGDFATIASRDRIPELSAVLSANKTYNREIKLAVILFNPRPPTDNLLEFCH